AAGADADVVGGVEDVGRRRGEHAGERLGDGVVGEGLALAGRAAVRRHDVDHPVAVPRALAPRDPGRALGRGLGPARRLAGAQSGLSTVTHRARALVPVVHWIVSVVPSRAIAWSTPPACRSSGSFAPLRWGAELPSSSVS